jgi:SAM-dependent methyltransferase
MNMIKKVQSEEDLEYFGHARFEMLDFIPDSCRNFLEIGCGEGHFGELVKQKHDCQYHGVELYREASTKAERVLDTVFTGPVEEVLSDLSLNAYDCIVCNDVLEHLSNPFVILKSLKKVLKPGGYVVSSIPNVRYINNLRELLFEKDWEYKHEGGILDFTHLRFFTKKSIMRMYEHAGYNVITNEGINRIEDVRFSFLNAIMLGYFSDTLYPQFATVAKLKE